MHKSLPCKNFTLVELLMVVAIIIMLAGLLLPVLKQARERGLQISCLGNIKQIGYAAFGYSTEYSEYYPMRTGKPASSPYNYWPYLLMPYLNNPYTYVCPAHKENTTRLEVYKISGEWYLGNYYNPDYGYNWRYIGTSYALGFTTAPDYGPPAKAQQVKSPGSTVVFADSIASGSNASQIFTDRGYYIIAWLMEVYESVSDRHNKGTSVLWADGHASYSKRSDIYVNSTSDNSKEYLWDRE